MLPAAYYFYGSHDSNDIDVMMEFDNIPARHIALDIISELKKNNGIDWNINLVTIRDGHIVNAIPSKGSPDNLNNSLFHTYGLHKEKQIFPMPIESTVPRNLCLNIYKCFRTVLSLCTRTQYRTVIKPTLKWLHPFHHKIESLKQIDFTQIDSFQSKSTHDVDAWKIIAFTLGQSLSLIDGIEIYTKTDLVRNHPELEAFIYRQTLHDPDKVTLNSLKELYLGKVKALEIQNPEKGILLLGQERIGMENEVIFFSVCP